MLFWRVCRPTRKKRRPRFLKADQSLADYVKEDYSDEQKNLSLGKLLDD